MSVNCLSQVTTTPMTPWLWLLLPEWTVQGCILHCQAFIPVSIPTRRNSEPFGKVRTSSHASRDYHLRLPCLMARMALVVTKICSYGADQYSLQCNTPNAHIPAQIAVSSSPEITKAGTECNHEKKVSQHTRISKVGSKIVIT